MSRKLILKNVRFSYVRVFEAEQYQGVGEYHYSVTLLIPKTDTALIKQINDAVKAEAQDYFSRDVYRKITKARYGMEMHRRKKDKPGMKVVTTSQRSAKRNMGNRSLLIRANARSR